MPLVIDVDSGKHDSLRSNNVTLKMPPFLQKKLALSPLPPTKDPLSHSKKRKNLSTYTLPLNN